MAAGFKEIPLSKGHVALVDADDFAWVSQWKWYALDNKRGNVYAARGDWREGRTHYLHRELMSPAPGLVVDHIDGDSLRCTRDNLRVCTPSENARNRRQHRNSASPYKGIACTRGRWSAQILVGGKRLHVCGFDTAEEAARAYDHAAIEHYGEFARLNFPKAA